MSSLSNRNIEGDDGETALHWAAYRGDMDKLDLLLASGEIPLSFKDKDGVTPLARACQAGQVIALKRILDAGSDIASLISSTGPNGLTPLHLAVQGNHVLTAGLLIRAGADINAADAQGRSPLHWACEGGLNDLVRLFLTHGANINATDVRGQTPLFSAIAGGTFETASLLIGKGVDLDTPNNQGITPTQMAELEKRQGVAYAIRRGKTTWWTRMSLQKSPAGLIIYMLAAIIVTGSLIFWIAMPSPHPFIIGFTVLFIPVTTIFLILHVTTSDPGRLALTDPVLAIDYLSTDRSRICMTCHLVKPVRSKHCASCDCCVARMDHHCVWVNNCVGRANHRAFIILLLFTVATQLQQLIALPLVVIPAVGGVEGPLMARILHLTVTRSPYLASVVICAVTVPMVGKLLAGQIRAIGRNLTSNEMINWSRYDYISEQGGQHKTAFDRGTRANWMEFLRGWPGYTFAPANNDHLV